jgi:CubicO group peptidase (beta-lactamase class C family)
MAALKAEVDPAEVGLDPARLERVDRHLTRYVDTGKLPGWLVTVSRKGRLAHVAARGARDVAAGLPVETDTLWRIYSMTKPISSVAAMILYEEGAFELTDPVSTFIPSFDGVRVFTGGSDLKPLTVPAAEPVRIWHLLTHTSGLTYGFHRAHPVDAEWNYSVSTDVLGRVIEVASGQGLDEFLASRVLRPLGMADTAFSVAEADTGRLAALYTPGPGGQATRLDSLGQVSATRPAFLGGGGGLISTAGDYHRFAEMLLHRPGSPAGMLDGVRLLSPRTVAYMTRNHLPGGADLETFGRPLFAETPFRGVGFGLGFAMVVDAAAGKTLSSEGEYSWGGAASTAFWVDPAQELTVAFFTQLLPSSAYPIRSQLRQLVYQALTD